LLEESQPNLHTRIARNKCFRSTISVITFALFVLAIATLQILSILISETPKNGYGQTQATVTDNNSILRVLSWTSPWNYNNLKATTSNMITIAASISDNSNNNNTPFLLPSPPSSQSSDNNSSSPAVGPASNTSPSNNAVNSNSPSRGDNSNNGNSTDTHHFDQSNSHYNTASSSNNHVQDQHKKHKYLSAADTLPKAFGRSMQQFTGGEIPFP
jgi:hypothetical protein